MALGVYTEILLLPELDGPTAIDKWAKKKLYRVSIFDLSKQSVKTKPPIEKLRPLLYQQLLFLSTGACFGVISSTISREKFGL